MIQLKDSKFLAQIFQYVASNQELMRNLKIVYEGWFICAKFCTNQDIQSISLGIDKISKPRVQQGTFVMKEKRGFKWANKLSEKIETEKEDIQNVSYQKEDTLDMTRIHELLPSSYQFIHPDIQVFIEKLLQNQKLMPYQITYGLCGALSIATSTESKIRARSVLWQLTLHPNSQLTNVHSVARYIMGNVQEKETIKIQKKQETYRETINDRDLSQKKTAQNVNDCVIL